MSRMVPREIRCELGQGEGFEALHEQRLRVVECAVEGRVHDLLDPAVGVFGSVAHGEQGGLAQGFMPLA